MSGAGKYFNLYINSSIHVSLAVVSFVLITSLHLEIPVEQSLLIFVFFGTVTGYNFVKYAGVAKLHHSSLTNGLKTTQIFSIFSFVGLLLSCFFVSFSVLLWTIGFGLLTLLYALPIFSKRRNLRSISGLKIFIIAFVWAGVTVILPATGVKNGIFDTLVIEFIQRFLFVLVLILPFEIRDLKYDLELLGTIPQRVGVTWTKFFGFGILFIVVFLEFLKETATWKTELAVVVIALVTAIFVWRSKEKQSRYYASFWVEGIPVFWLILLLLLRCF